MIRIALTLALLWPMSGYAGEQIPCWKAQAVMAWALGDEAKAEKIARKYYSKAQIAEARKRCNI